MKLKLTLTNNENLYIDLINDPWIHNWATTVTSMELDTTECVALGSTSNTHVDLLYNSIDNLTNGFTELIKLGIDIPGFFPTNSELKHLQTDVLQLHINRIHRWLVFLMFRKPYIVNDKDYIPVNINQLFETQFDDMLSVLLTLNQLAHEIEKNYTSPGLSTFPGTRHQSQYWDQGFKDNDTISLFADAPVHHLLTNNNHDVWLAKRILGKDFRECWLDNDDPSYEDITNVGECLHYAFEIDPLNDLTDFYNSEQFVTWMKQHNRSTDVSQIGRIPLGNIINKPVNLEDIMKNCKIERLEVI